MFDKLTVALQIIFVLAKIFDKVDWSWWLVFTPLYVYLGICFILIIMAVSIDIINDK